MHDNNPHLVGPDFLTAVAQAEAANGNTINADIYRERAQQWKRDQADLQNTRQRCQDLEDQLSRIQRTVQAQ